MKLSNLSEPPKYVVGGEQMRLLRIRNNNNQTLVYWKGSEDDHSHPYPFGVSLLY